LLHHVHGISGHQQLGDIIAERLRHFLAANIGYTLHRQVDMDWITGLQVVLDALDDEFDQLAIGVHQHGNKKVALRNKQIAMVQF